MEWFDYSIVTGDLYWKQSPCNNTPVGSIAGSIDHNGHRIVGFMGRRYRVNRLIWKLVTGEDPTLQVDHKDGERDNNAWHNLRLATLSQNNCNCKPKSRQTKSTQHLPKGVVMVSPRVNAANPYLARIRKDNKTFNLGYFSTPEQAHDAYCLAAKNLHKEFARTE